MLTDRYNRPMLALSFSVYALLMGLMALASYASPLGGVPAVLLACLIWPMLFLSIVAGMAWFGDAPVVRRLTESPAWHRQAVGAVVFLAGFCTLTFAAIAVWCYESTASYGIACFLTAAAALHHLDLVRHEDNPPDFKDVPRSRLV